jgi:alkanesulfonate monooxygenase
MDKYGRNPNDLKILPGVAIFTGRTAEEAEEKYEALSALVNPAAAVALLGARTGIDLTGVPLDEPVPELKGNDVRVSNPQLMFKLAQREKLTLRGLVQRYAAAGPHNMVRGTPSQVADQLEYWFLNRAADGFIFLPVYLPGALNDFVDMIVPELQRRGLFRKEYEGKTLRENMGLPRPENVFLKR